jgi:hypothetical protein
MVEWGRISANKERKLVLRAVIDNWTFFGRLRWLKKLQEPVDSLQVYPEQVGSGRLSCNHVAASRLCGIDIVLIQEARASNSRYVRIRLDGVGWLRRAAARL